MSFAYCSISFQCKILCMPACVCVHVWITFNSSKNTGRRQQDKRLSLPSLAKSARTEQPANIHASSMSFSSPEGLLNYLASFWPETPEVIRGHWYYKIKACYIKSNHLWRSWFENKRFLLSPTLKCSMASVFLWKTPLMKLQEISEVYNVWYRGSHIYLCLKILFLLLHVVTQN